jgi:hypothetical protein
MKIKLVNAKSVFIVTLLVIFVTIIGVWLYGLRLERTVFENAVISTGILSGVLFLFMTVGLFRGIKLKDDMGSVIGRQNKKSNSRSSGFDFPDFSDAGGKGSNSSSDFSDADGDGCEGIIGGILLWVLVTVVAGILIWLLATLLWPVILVIIAMLYWVFFRALRLVFKNSARCKGKLGVSILYGLGHTLLYTGWIYGVIVGIHYLKTGL